MTDQSKETELKPCEYIDHTVVIGHLADIKNHLARDPNLSSHRFIRHNITLNNAQNAIIQLLKEKEELVEALAGILDVSWTGGMMDGSLSSEEEGALQQASSLLDRLSPEPETGKEQS